MLFCCILDGGCPSVGQPRQHIICYYDGKRPVSSLNVCLCTHLIYTSVGIDEYGKLHLSEGMLIYIHLNLTALKLFIQIERHFVLFMFYFQITDVRSDISAIREQNPRLRVVVSLGGEAVKGSLFSSLITDNESFTNLTSSINEFHKDDVIDGLEIDWEWPVRDGGKKDRMKLIRYARVST